MWQQIVKDWLKSEDVDRPQAWLAKRAGCSESYLSQCLNVHVEPTDGFLYGLEAAMTVPRGTLVDVRRELRGVSSAAS